MDDQKGSPGIRRQVISNTLWIAAERFGNHVLSLLTFTVLSRLLLPEDFGIVAMAFIFISFTNIFLEIGFAEAIVQRDEIEDDHLHSVFWISIGVGAALTLLAVIFSPLVAWFFSEPAVKPIVIALSGTFLLGALGSTHRAIMLRDMDMKELGMRSVAGRFAGAIVGVTLAFQGFGAWSLVFQQLIASVVSVVLIWRLCRWRPKFRFTKECFNDLWGFSVTMLGHKILIFITKKLDSLVIGFFMGSVMLGYYTIAYRIYEILGSMVAGVVSPAVFPIFSRLQKRDDRLREVFLHGSKLLSVIVFPVYVGGFVLAEPLILGVFGETWQPSVWVFKLLSLVGLVECFLGLNGTVIISLGKPLQLLYIRAASAVLFIASYLFAVEYSIAHVAFAFLCVMYLAVSPLHFRLAFSTIGTGAREYFSKLGGAWVSSVLMSVCVWIVSFVLLDSHSYLLQLTAGVATGVLIYIASMVTLFKDLSLELLRLVRQVIPGLPYQKST